LFALRRDFFAHAAAAAPPVFAIHGCHDVNFTAKERARQPYMAFPSANYREADRNMSETLSMRFCAKISPTCERFFI
jgi:hypothetical protein